MGLNRFDETFSHQVSLPHTMVGSSDPSWRERYWISIQDTTGDVVLSCGFGKYPNQDVLEAFVVLADRTRQHNLRFARALAPESDVTRVGPFSVEIVRPFEELALVLEDNSSGISFDVRWTGRMEPMLEDRHFQMHRSRVTYDAMRYVQVGRASGRIRTPDGELAVEPETWWGERDHSWGTRPLPRAPGAPPSERPEWRMLLFSPIQLPTFGFHAYLYEAVPGRPVHLSGGVSRPLGDPGGPPTADDEVVALDHDLRWLAGAPAPTLLGGTLEAMLGDGRRLTLELEALPGRAHLRGGGFEGWNGWFQGHWKGESSFEHDVWQLDDRSQFYRYAKAGSDHLVKVRHDDQVGYGIVEYMVLPGYAKYQDAIPPRPAGPTG